jgi:WD40 repeat protein
VAVTPDGLRAVSASGDRTLKMWDLETEEVLATFTCDSRGFCCAFSEVLKLIVAGDAGGPLHFLSLEETKTKN